MTPTPVPPKRGIFTRVADAQFRAVVRKAQGFTDAESAQQAGVAKRTVSSYIETARKKLGFLATQDLIWAYYREYAPVLLNPQLDDRNIQVPS